MGAVDAIEWACVLSVTFKMTEQVDQWIHIQFCIKLEHSSMETIWMIQKDAAMGNWWLAASSWQRTTQASHHVQRFLVKHQITQVTPLLYNPDLVPCNFWLFLKLKSPLKGKRFQTIDGIWENMMGQLMVLGRTVWSPQMPTLKGTEASLSVVSCGFFNKHL